MSDESNRESPNANSNKTPDQLKASDFFPPGTGWNKSTKPSEGSTAPRPEATPAVLPKQH